MVSYNVMEYLSSPFVWMPLLFVIVSTIYSRLTATLPPPSDLPWVGKNSSNMFAETRAHLTSFNNIRQLLHEGYNKFSRNDKTYIFPDFSGQPEVVIPSTDMRWLLDQPDNVLSVSELHYDILAGPYAFTDPTLLKDPFHEHVVRKSLSRRIGPLIPDLYDEISCALDDTWGTDTENWKEICIFENMMKVIARASNRVFVGLPLCRNEEYLKAMGAFAQAVNATFMVLRLVPKILEPIVGRLITIPNHRHYRQAAAFHDPLVRERLANIAKKDANPDWEWEEPNDYLTWHIRVAQKDNNQSELQPEMIGRRLLPINFAAIHTTVFTITNCLLDLVSTKSVEENGSLSSPLEVIRQEARAEYIASKGLCSKQSLARLVHADSAIRESMRVSNFLTRGLQRKVIAKEGIENKRAGWKLPFGTRVGYDAHSVQHDPRIYPNPDSYDPFRFARAREHSGSVGEQSKTAESLESKQLSISTTSGTFLPFGHGRHACPGRFMVAHELKMLLAYATMFYEIEPLETRPPNTWFGQHVIPPMKQTIRVRRRRADELGF
ncbi:hypothetical protein E2P81_ATG08009 [Venturia nashicola]|uniref:Cytochrome P450 n=1 Tax=Venturia nashicola TaxID=86259 RepID=A0A4Z1NSK1_9PEZI|nr:hypothetical protein E6O75_ATG08183 [Venturia nashicola]TLD26197.1 hypothetical protein E2P81_ATG08009 [Venturia nashicola]